MFKCQNKSCRKQVGPGQPINKVVIETRPKTYENFVYKRKRKTKHIRVDQGYETVKEISVCPDCYETMTGLQPRVVVPVKKEAPKFNKPKFKPYQKHRSNKNNWKNSRQDSKAVKKDSTPKKKPIVETVKPLKK